MRRAAGLSVSCTPLVVTSCGRCHLVRARGASRRPPADRAGSEKLAKPIHSDDSTYSSAATARRATLCEISCNVDEEARRRQGHHERPRQEPAPLRPVKLWHARRFLGLLRGVGLRDELHIHVCNSEKFDRAGARTLPRGRPTWRLTARPRPPASWSARKLTANATATTTTAIQPFFRRSHKPHGLRSRRKR